MNRCADPQQEHGNLRYAVMTTSQQPGQGAYSHTQQPYIPHQYSPGGVPQPSPPPPAPTPTRRSPRWPWIAGIVAAFVVGLAIGGSGGSSTPTPAAAQPAPTPSSATAPTAPVASSAAAAPAAPAAPAEPSGPATEVNDGTYQVGVDVAAGRYKTTGPGSDSFGGTCYLERAKNDSGELDSIISNDNISGPGSVTVKAGEFVKFSGGCTWTKQ